MSTIYFYYCKLIIIIFIIPVQHLPFLWGIYVIMPIGLLYKSHAVIQFFRQHWKRHNIMYSCCAAVAIELLVLSFFYRFVLTILIVGLVVFKGSAVVGIN